jgi:uncharacterized protein involved in exopolysaccharide biosynthesis
MRRLIRWAARLYPKPWRERYGVEFETLLADLKPDLRTSLDVVRGAILMQVTRWNYVGRILAVSGTLGALIAFGISLAMPRTYASQALIKIWPGPAPSAVIHHINSMEQIILSGVGLATTINKFDLYMIERKQMPIEDLIELMKKHIQIRPVVQTADAGSRVLAFTVQFSYVDRQAAQLVTEDLVSRFITENIRVRGARPSGPMVLEVVDPASLPVSPISPRPSQMTAMGLFIGLALGAAGAYVRQATAH